MKELWTKIDELTKASVRASLCIVTGAKGSTPRKAGSKMLVAEDGRTWGTIGGGCIEHTVVKEAVAMCAAKAPVMLRFDLEEDLEMSCGGSVEVYIEPIVPTYHLVIFGAGHVGAALARYATDFGFHVAFVDNREEFAAKQEALGHQAICGDYVTEARNISSDSNTFFVVVTPKHAFDHDVTAILGKKPFAYLGMIGSTKKVAEAKRYFLDNNLLTESEIEKIDMPIGIKFNAETPEEIAVSILAKIIDVKNNME